jgi:hypothetical protein
LEKMENGWSWEQKTLIGELVQGMEVSKQLRKQLKFLQHDVGELVHLILHFCRRQSCILTAFCCSGVGTIGCIMMIQGNL